MKKFIFVIFASLIFGVSINAQTTATASTPATTETKPKRQNFRSKKDRLDKQVKTNHQES